ncbi:hypothetical protein SCHPADRAFT_904176 [Schizopora paradoxa]|uniref:Uncharacterized protein n=1 Tax=Schizopora paradoxa TaxID=27342 RepID=A0A0H2RPF5_9AGAM|nr:hypothetical protein SCHPADRAFT_904176 [Schizopora paradoxa]
MVKPASSVGRPSNSQATPADSLELVAPIKASSRAKLIADSSYTSLTVYNSSGVDPELNKSLTKAITTVDRRVDSAVTSFRKVHRAIIDPKIALCLESPGGKALLREWQEIEMAFENDLRTSGNVAQQGALMIDDFLSILMPYLVSDTSVAEKRRELNGYRESLKKGEKCAGVFASNFRETSNRVLDFRCKWVAHAKESNAYLCSEIDKLHSDIIAASQSQYRRNESEIHVPHSSEMGR